MEGFRLVRRRNGNPITIAHGVCGSRELPINEWLEADVRWACNPGAKDQPHYWTGFHVFRDLETAEAYQQRFKHPQPEVMRVTYRKAEKKPTNPDVLLTRWILLHAPEETN